MKAFYNYFLHSFAPFTFPECNDVNLQSIEWDHKDGKTHTKTFQSLKT